MLSWLQHTGQHLRSMRAIASNQSLPGKKSALSRYTCGQESNTAQGFLHLSGQTISQGCMSLKPCHAPCPGVQGLEPEPQPAGHGLGAVAELPRAHRQTDGRAAQHPAAHAGHHARRRLRQILCHQLPEGPLHSLRQSKHLHIQVVSRTHHSCLMLKMWPVVLPLSKLSIETLRQSYPPLQESPVKLKRLLRRHVQR